MQTMTSHSYSLGELDKEARMGGQGAETSAREVRVIDISDFERRKYEIAEQIWSASVEIGFFQVSGHGIAQANVRERLRLLHDVDCDFSAGMHNGLYQVRISLPC